MSRSHSTRPAHAASTKDVEFFRNKISAAASFVVTEAALLHEDSAARQGHFDKLCIERPRDLTLQVAVGDRVGWTTLYEFPDTGLSTLVNGRLPAPIQRASLCRKTRSDCDAYQSLGRFCRGRSAIRRISSPISSKLFRPRSEPIP